MSYNLIINDQFQRANTTVGSGANSTTGLGVPDAYEPPSTESPWQDITGDYWNIASHVGQIGSSVFTANSPINNGCVRPSSEAHQDGSVRIAMTAACSAGPMVRYTPANGGSAIGFFLFSANSIYKSVQINGSESHSQIATLPTLPTDIVFQVNTTQGSGTTQYAITIFESDGVTPVYTGNFNDSTAALQNVSGADGVCSFGQGAFLTQFESYSLSATLSAATISTTSVYKTIANLSASTPTGGTSPLSSQWHRNGVAIGGATSLTYTDTGLTPGQTYAYTLVTTDSSTPTPGQVTSNVLSVTTASANTWIIGFGIDSISYGFGGGPPFARDNAITAFTSLGIPAIEVNLGISGAYSGNVVPSGGSYYAQTIAAMNAAGVDTFHFFGGVNDSATAQRTTPTQFGTNVSAFISGMFSSVPTLKRVFLCDLYQIPSPATQWDATSNVLLAEYNTVLQSLVNGTTILRGSTIPTSITPELDEVGDVHPSTLGYVELGLMWALPMIQQNEASTAAGAGGGGGGSNAAVRSSTGVFKSN